MISMTQKREKGSGKGNIMPRLPQICLAQPLLHTCALQCHGQGLHVATYTEMNEKFSSLGTLTTPQLPSNHTWSAVTLLGGAHIEHFHRHRKFYCTASFSTTEPVTRSNKISHLKSLIALKNIEADPALHLSKAGVWLLKKACISRVS